MLALNPTVDGSNGMPHPGPTHGARCVDGGLSPGSLPGTQPARPAVCWRPRDRDGGSPGPVAGRRTPRRRLRRRSRGTPDSPGCLPTRNRTNESFCLTLSPRCFSTRGGVLACPGSVRRSSTSSPSPPPALSAERNAPRARHEMLFPPNWTRVETVQRGGSDGSTRRIPAWH